MLGRCGQVLKRRHALPGSMVRTVCHEGEWDLRRRVEVRAGTVQSQGAMRRVNRGRRAPMWLIE